MYPNNHLHRRKEPEMTMKVGDNGVPTHSEGPSMGRTILHELSSRNTPGTPWNLTKPEVDLETTLKRGDEESKMDRQMINRHHMKSQIW